MAAGWQRISTSPSSARSEAKITHMAQHDALTELPNRVLLGARLEQAYANHAQWSPRTWRSSYSISTASRRSTTRLDIRRATCCCALSPYAYATCMQGYDLDSPTGRR